MGASQVVKIDHAVLTKIYENIAYSHAKSSKGTDNPWALILYMVINLLSPRLFAVSFF